MSAHHESNVEWWPTKSQRNKGRKSKTTTHKLKSTKWTWIQPMNPIHPYKIEIKKPSSTKTTMNRSKVCESRINLVSGHHATSQRRNENSFPFNVG